MLSLTLVGAALAALVGAVPLQQSSASDVVAKRADPSNGAYDALFNWCVATLSEPKVSFTVNPFGYSDFCTAAAASNPDGVDAYLAAVWKAVNGTPANQPPKSVNMPRLSQGQYNDIVTAGGNKAGITTQQSFIDFYYTALSNIPAVAGGPGPYPENTYVIAVWDEISAWTGFCSNKEIPYGNLADWFQYSSTVQGPATTCTAPPPPPDPSNGAYAALFNWCVATLSEPKTSFTINPFGYSDFCTAAAASNSGGVDAYLAEVWKAVNGTPANQPPKSINLARLSQGQYNDIETAGGNKAGIATQQSFIDFYYTALSDIPSEAGGPGPYPVNTYVIGVWDKISAWTGFCKTKEIPYGNLADWFQYSSTVNGPATHC